LRLNSVYRWVVLVFWHAMDRRKDFAARVHTLSAESVRSFAMSINKVNLSKKLAVGTVLVALSGMVPQPIVNTAHAATATINAVGTFGGGIQMGTTSTNLLFGSMVASGNTGSMQVTPGAATVTNNGFFNGAQQVGTIAFNAAAGGLPVNVTVAGFTAAFGLRDVGSGTQGSITIDQVSMSGPFLATAVLKTATPAKVATLTGTAGAAATADLNVGAVVNWSGARPIGQFTVPLTVTITY